MSESYSAGLLIAALYEVQKEKQEICNQKELSLEEFEVAYDLLMEDLVASLKSKSNAGILSIVHQNPISDISDKLLNVKKLKIWKAVVDKMLINEEIKNILR